MNSRNFKMSSFKRAHIHKQDVPQTFGVKIWTQKWNKYNQQRSRFGTVAGGQRYLLGGGFFRASSLANSIRKTNHLKKRSNAVSKQDETD